MLLENLTDYNRLLRKYRRELKEKFGFDFNTFLKENGIEKASRITEGRINELRTKVNFDHDYFRNVLIKATITAYNQSDLGVK